MRPGILLLILCSLSLAPGYGQAQESGVAKSVQQMVGENHLYFMDFLFFSKLAVNVMSDDTFIVLVAFVFPSDHSLKIYSP